MRKEKCLPVGMTRTNQVQISCSLADMVQILQALIFTSVGVIQQKRDKEKLMLVIYGQKTSLVGSQISNISHDHSHMSSHQCCKYTYTRVSMFFEYMVFYKREDASIIAIIHTITATGYKPY